MGIDTAAASIPGDFNNDGTVGAADYVVWRKGLGTAYTHADYNAWRTNFGRFGASTSATAVGGSASTMANGLGIIDAAVPETTTPALIAIGGFALLATSRRRPRQAPVPFSGPDVAFQLAPDLGFGVDEVSPAFGDSGGPVFVGGAIAGVNSFIVSSFPTDVTPDDGFDATWGALNFATRVSSFRAFLTTATGGQAVFIPEPSSAVLLMLDAIGVSRLAKKGC
jgi:hypothetical protein